MRNQFKISIFAVTAAMALAPLALAQTAARSGGTGGNRDFSGVWNQGGVRGFAPAGGGVASARDLAEGRIPRFGFSREEPPMQPWAVERHKTNQAGMPPNEGGQNERNQALYPYCLPEGMPRVMTIGSFEVVHAPDKVYLLHERNHNVRRIYLDGKRHLEGMAPTFLGTSHGRWDGDTLVVETGNILSLDGYLWLDMLAHPFTDSLRVVERFRRVAHDRLQVDFLFDDPGAYTKPWTGLKTYELQTDWEITEFIICNDHLQEDFLRDMKSGKPAGRP